LQPHSLSGCRVPVRNLVYNRHVMRTFACLVFVSLSAFSQSSRPLKLFPIPADMHEIWPGAALTIPEKKLLQKALEPVLQSNERYCEKKSAFESIDSASISLGKLGTGVIILVPESCVCGDANCPIYLYARAKDGYRIVLGDTRHDRGAGGWAFGVVESTADVPDLVLASNAGGPQVVLTLYRYDGSRFVQQGCETLTRKQENTTSWWNPSEVDVQPCADN
jgi:hypothetical protein